MSPFFKYSMGHLPASLRSLMENLKNSNHEFKILRQSQLMQSIDENGKTFLDENKFQSAQEKNFFCYDFATSVEKVKNYNGLPPIEDWKDTLTGKVSVTDEEYRFIFFLRKKHYFK